MTKINSSIFSLLNQRAMEHPDKIAYAFLKDGTTIGNSLTYGDLNRTAKAIATILRSQGTPGMRALLLYSSSEEFLPAFFGCLYAGIIAVPTPAIEAVRLKRSLPRLKAISRDSQATLILTTSRLVSQLEELYTSIFKLQSNQLLVTDAINLKDTPELELIIGSEDLAYLQYTSGSTSMPKGVMISHDNLMANLADITETHGYDQTSISAIWTPYFHDYGLVNLIQSIYADIPCYVMSPVTFIKRPIRWLEAISRYQVTHSGAPNFAFDYCVSQIKAKQLTGIDLSSWRVAHTGAEPIRHDTIQKFAQIFQPYGFSKSAFYPSYGLAEATLMVTTRGQEESPVFLAVSAQDLAKNKVIEISEAQTEITTQTLTSCGYPTGNTKVTIVNRETLTQCAADEVGEIWVSSKSVGQGYWNRPSETQKTFQASLPDFPSNSFLRTGDLGFLNTSQLFVTGRFKDLIIIRGQNYYPQDIELTVEKSHPKLRANSSAAFSIDVKGVEKLVITAEVDARSHKNLNADEVSTAISNAITQNYELPLHGIVLLKRGSILKTSSGKIQRHACRQAFINDKLERIATWTLDISKAKSVVVPRNEYEFRLEQIWREVLDIENNISINDNFFELGGNSLLAATVLTKIETAFGQTLPLSALSEASTIEQLANYLDKPDWSSSPRSLVAIKPQGSKRPFFYVHPRSGTVMLFGNLARYIDPERPFYGLQAVGLNGEQEPLTRIEDMAAHYIKEIETIQPQGPYLLGGRCLGGKIALEMAQQLLLAGQQILLLVLVESPRSPMADPILAKRIRKNIKKMRELGILQASNFQKVMNANDLARLSYKNKVYPGRLAYFFAEKPFHDPSFEFGWASLVMEEMDIYQVPGDHFTMDEEPNIQVFADKLSNCLNESESKSENPNIYLIQGHIQHQQGNLEEAITSYQKALTLESDKAQFYFILGNALREQGNLEEAIASYQKAIAIKPQYWYYQNLAEIFNQQEKIESTIAAYSQTINLGYVSSQIYNCLASAQVKNEDLEGAIATYEKALALNPENLVVYLRLGKIQLKQGDLKSAIALFQQAIELAPDHAAGYNSLGNAQRQQGDREGAILSYRHSLKLNPQQYGTYIALGNTLFQLGQTEEAITAYTEAIKLDPNRPGVYSALGNAQLKCEKIEKAIASYQKAITLDPEYFEVYQNLGDSLTKLEQLDEALNTYQQALKLQPDNLNIYCLLGNIHRKQGNIEAAINTYQKAIAINPNYVSSYINLANTLSQEGKLDETIALCQKAIKFNPKNPHLCRILGNAHLRCSDFEAAIIAYQKAIELAPSHPAAYNGLGQAQRQKGDKQAAITSYRRSLELNPQQHRICIALANNLYQLEQIEAAATAFEKALQLDSDHPAAYNGLGNIYRQQENHEAAMKYYCRSLELNPQQYMIHTELGNSLFQLGKFPEAAKAFQNAISLDDRRPGVYTVLGDAQLKFGNFLSAISSYEKALELNPQQPFGVFKNLGDALCKQGKTEKAIAAYTEALKLRPNNKAILKSLEILSRI